MKSVIARSIIALLIILLFNIALLLLGVSSEHSRPLIVLFSLCVGVFFKMAFFGYRTGSEDSVVNTVVIVFLSLVGYFEHLVINWVAVAIFGGFFFGTIAGIAGIFRSIIHSSYWGVFITMVLSGMASFAIFRFITF